MPKLIKEIDYSYYRANDCCPRCNSPLRYFSGHSSEGSHTCFQCGHTTFDSCLNNDVEVEQKSFLIKNIKLDSIGNYIMNEYHRDRSNSLYNRYEMAEFFKTEEDAKSYMIENNIDFNKHKIIDYGFIGAFKSKRPMKLYLNDEEIDLFISNTFYSKIFNSMEELEAFEEQNKETKKSA